MNTIPLTFNERQIDRTVLGGTQVVEEIKLPVAAILINTGGIHFRQTMIENLLECGFKDIISIESDPENYNIEEISMQFPSVKFVVPLENVNEGDMINMGIEETKSEWVLVLKDTLNITKNILSPRIFEFLTKDNPYCVAPLLSFNGERVTCCYFPSIKKSLLEVVTDSVVAEGKATLYPQDFIALYNRKKFIDLGGFDYTIKSSYWQNLDLCFRSWLWGEKITLSTVLNISYNQKTEGVDKTANIGSSRFFLKDLAPHFKNDHAFVSPMEFFSFLPRSSCGLFESLRQFADGRDWVKKNKYRFKFDAVYLVENWGKI